MASEDGPNDGRLDLRQAAAALGYSAGQIRALIKNGVVPKPDRGAYGALAGFSPNWVEAARIALAAAPEDAKDPQYGKKRQIPIKRQEGFSEVASPGREPVDPES